MERQKVDAARIKGEEARLIPEGIDFSNVSGLSNELKQKMLQRQPRSVADAERIEGMTPAALAIIVAHIRNYENSARRGAA
jgi:tRNA uridine 5-carboxymethylaminomethyl modification enzyme